MKIIIAGRTGSGKNKLAEYLASTMGLTVLKTSTNRPRRYPEEDTYHFYTKKEADAIPAEDKLYLTTALDGYERWTNKTDLLAADICILDALGFPSAIRLFQTYGHKVALVYVEAPEATRRMSALKLAVNHGSDGDEALKVFEHRNTQESPMFDKIEAAITDEENRQAADAMLYPNFQTKTNSIYGEDLLLHWENEFTENSLLWPAGILLKGKADGTGLWQIGGYAEFTNREPFILEPEDWTRIEWDVLCKLNGFDPEVTQRIVMHAHRVEAYIEPAGTGNMFLGDGPKGGSDDGENNPPA